MPDFKLLSASSIAIIKAIYFNPDSTCLEISKQVENSIPNVTKNINDLIRNGIVYENGYGDSRGGRKPLLYSLVADSLYIISVAMNQFNVQAAIMDITGSIISDIIQFDIDIYKDVNTLELVIEQVLHLFGVSPIEKNKIMAVGISMPGVIDIEKGVNKSYFKNNSKNIRDMLSERIGIPVFIDNDSAAIALAELKLGLGRTIKEIMVVNIGWGIGLGMIVNGKIFRGSTGYAGEFSHIPLFKNGKVCRCGKVGCLETETSLIIIANKARAEIAELQALNTGNILEIINAVFALAREGSPAAIKLITEAGYHLGQAIAILIHIMNPQVVVLSGKGREAGRVWLAPIEQAINELCIPTLLNESGVVLSPIEKFAQLKGTAGMVIENLDDVLLKNEMNKKQLTHH
ncbi:transcriptional regulator, MarR family [Mucilaginibacter mallensis]|uniref:Transcriptional regulator, MarR family n=1 Tax=Mucilaginibacter mallensis TaxID=652787 RepID=A0A1H1ZND6_MUCMA|nr:ROK family protein [Mucilaginibacter mallensis]SDT35214.1 transcriptional regulator, MarR family [Mucilaginibacter mallensis]